nr:Stk1 family PASTA domain-containing Ser/Thr kinase [Lachnospiraceae bacterium]
MLTAGTVLAQRYEIVGRVGSGGMADVYKAKDHKLNRFVAVKVMKPEFREDGTFISKFRREAQAAAGLANPNIVNVFDVGEDNGNYYIVMELVEGITLKEYINKKGKLSVRESTSIAIQVCMGLAAAHSQGIVHRDIKPQNIIISTDGKVKVTDFGIARAASSNTISANAMGSVHYSSPEQVRGGYSDSRSDIYSLGITLYEMVTGRVPFDGETTVAIAIKHLQDEMDPPSKYTPDLPYALEQIIYKCTQKSVERRYQTMNDVISDLKKSLNEPQGHFVSLTPLSDHAQAGDSMELEKEEESADSKTPDKNRREEEKRTFTSTDAAKRSRDRGDDYDDEDDYDDDDDDDEGIGGILEKIMTVIGFVVGALIIAILIYFIAKAAGLLDGGGNETSASSVQSITESLESSPAESSAAESGAAESAEASSVSEASSEETSSESEEPEPDKIPVPTITGLTEEVARTAANSVGLGLEYLGDENSDLYPAGTILRQEPEAGTEVEADSTIRYYLSSGPAGTEVPAVVGMTRAAAEDILLESGFSNISVTTANSETVSAGVVISMSPSEGERVQSSATITLVVSSGPANTSSETTSSSTTSGSTTSSSTTSGSTTSSSTTSSSTTSSGTTSSSTTSSSSESSETETSDKILVNSYTGLEEARSVAAAQREGLVVKVEYAPSD